MGDENKNGGEFHSSNIFLCCPRL